MCGRYASSANPDDLASYFTVEEPPDEVLPPSYNVAPTDPVYVVMERHEHRLLRVVRWGLVPSWSKDAKGAARMINARSELPCAATSTLTPTASSRRGAPSGGAGARHGAGLGARRTRGSALPSLT